MIQVNECGAFSFEKHSFCHVTWHWCQQNTDGWLGKCKERHRATTAWLNYKDWAHHHTGITLLSSFGDGSVSYEGDDLFLFLSPCAT